MTTLATPDVVPARAAGIRDTADTADIDGVHVDVVVLGAGFAGLGMAIQLRRRGTSSFLVLDKGDDVGGTWRDNSYPGVTCDVPSHLYSYSFCPKPDWSRVFAPGAEIQEYLGTCARDEGITPHVRLGTEVIEARWSEDEGRWRISTTRGTCTADVFVVAAGRLSEPHLPAIPGLDDFAGEVFHSARWPAGLDVTGRRVGVVGTGASAVQIVPGLAEQAAETVVFQRSAPWVLPREDREYTEAEKDALTNDPARRQRLRDELFVEAERGFSARRGRRPQIDELRDRARAHLEAQVPDPALRELLTPTYEIGCKRVLISNDYYPVFGSPSVTLETSLLTRVNGTGAVVANGQAYELDVIVLATGFQSTRPPYARRILGRSGQPLAEHWHDGMTAFASTAVHGYPNMFVINGPNATLGHNSAIFMIETQIDYVLGALEHLARSGDVLEVSLEAEQGYTRELDEESRSTVWMTGGCSSWYREAKGRLTLIWPGTATQFRERNGVFDPSAYRGRAAVR